MNKERTIMDVAKDLLEKMEEIQVYSEDPKHPEDLGRLFGELLLIDTPRPKKVDNTSNEYGEKDLSVDTHLDSEVGDE